MSAVYAARPGTVAYRVLAYLATLPPGTEITTSALGIELNIDAVSIPPCLDPAVTAGQVFQGSTEFGAFCSVSFTVTVRARI